METPYHLRQKILHGTIALFPLIKSLWNQARYIVSAFSPYGLDLETVFLVPFRMDSCKKRCFCHLPLRENTIIMPQSFLSVLLGGNDVVPSSTRNGFDNLSVVSCHNRSRFAIKTMFFRKYQFANDIFSFIFCTFAEHSH